MAFFKTEKCFFFILPKTWQKAKAKTKKGLKKIDCFCVGRCWDHDKSHKTSKPNRNNNSQETPLNCTPCRFVEARLPQHSRRGRRRRWGPLQGLSQLEDAERWRCMCQKSNPKLHFTNALVCIVSYTAWHERNCDLEAVHNQVGMPPPRLVTVRIFSANICISVISSLPKLEPS